MVEKTINGQKEKKKKKKKLTKLPAPLFPAEKNGELKLNRGDFVQILSVGHHGFWQGKIVTSEGETPQIGWFPSFCVEEVQRGKSA